MYPAPRAPKDTRQKWLAFGALVAVAVGVSIGASALKKRLASSLPQKEAETVPRPAQTIHPPAVAQASAVPVPAIEPDDGPHEHGPA